MEEEFVPVAKDLKGYVIGSGGCVIKSIQQKSGAKVVSKSWDAEGFIVVGNEEQKACAKRLILQTVDGGRINRMENEFNKVCYYIDGWNLPQDCKLKLVKGQEDFVALTGASPQYRLKPADDFEPLEPLSPSDDLSYLPKLKDDVLESLHKIKDEIKRKKYIKADMWCHFGTVIIRRPGEVTKEVWTIEEAADKFIGNRWKMLFKGGVSLDEKLFEEYSLEKTPEEYEDYLSRYDLAFVTPSGRQIRFKVWVLKKNLGKTLEDVPVPSGDVKNILDEIQFKDEFTRSRCRGWLTLPSRRYLQADIMFPGCGFDCRLTIRGRTDSAVDTEYVPTEDTRHALSRYLLELTFADGDDFGLRLPEGNMPDGFHLSYMRCSRRTVHEIMPGFSIILSKENSRSYQSCISEVESSSSTDFQLHCREWDELLNCGDWEPEAIVEKLPEFFRFVKKVQRIVVHEMKDTGVARTVPPEILARGRPALEAYGKALAGGKASFRAVPIMFIGQYRAGKTSLMKSLKGICFDPDEDSTVGVAVDPCYFKVTSESWKTGTTGDDDNSDEATSFEYQTANCIVDTLKKESKSTKLARESVNESSGDSGSEPPELPQAPSFTEPGNEKGIQAPQDPEPTLSRDIPRLSPDPKEGNKKECNHVTLHMPEEVAAVTETLLQSDWENNKEDIYSTLWDFAGQSVYYATHPLFLTRRAMYCLVYDLSLNPFEKEEPLAKKELFEESQDSVNLKTNLDYLDFWMESVACLSLNECREVGVESGVLPKKLPPVFLVCTHADKAYEGSGGAPEDLSRNIFGRLRDKPYGDHLCDVYFVDNTRLRVKKAECLEVLRLRNDILAVAKELPEMKEEIPIKWLKFDKALQELKRKGHKYISLETAKHIASVVCNIKEDTEIDTVMNFLHDLRSLIHFDDSPKLNKLVILDPQWLIDVFKSVITVKPYNWREKKYEDLWRKLEKDGILEEELLTYVWGTLCDSQETFEGLIGIMEKFSLLCSWPSDTSDNKNYLVPSMLKSHPPREATELISSATIPSLSIKFETGQVPPGLFPRLVLEFFQWGNKNYPSQVEPWLFHSFARFFISDEGFSVIFLCHSTFIEIVVHGMSASLDLEEGLPSKMTLEADVQRDIAGIPSPLTVRRQLNLILECMRHEFCWLRNMRYEMSVTCPVCCFGRKVNFCRTHNRQNCKEEQCLHFLSVSELCSAKKKILCKRPGFAKDLRIDIVQFGPWLDLSEHQSAVGEQDRRRLFPLLSPAVEGNEQKALALPCNILESLSSQSSDSTQIVSQWKQSLQLDQSSLEQPDPKSKSLIRCLARQAVCSNRLDVVQHLRQIAPAGTTGPLLPEDLLVIKIPVQQVTQLTITLSGGDEWKRVAEMLGLNPEAIRYLDRRIMNPADAFLAHIARHSHLTVGDLYDILCECGLPVIADKL